MRSRTNKSHCLDCSLIISHYGKKLKQSISMQHALKIEKRLRSTESPALKAKEEKCELNECITSRFKEDAQKLLIVGNEYSLELPPGSSARAKHLVAHRRS